MGNATQEAFFNSYLQTTRSSSDDFSVNVKIPIVHMLVQVGMKAMSKKASKKTISSTKVEEQTVIKTDAYSSSDLAADETNRDHDQQESTAVISDAQSESLRSILEKLTPRQQTALHVASRCPGWCIASPFIHATFLPYKLSSLLHSVISNLQETVQQWDGGLKHLIEKVASLSLLLHQQHMSCVHSAFFHFERLQCILS